MGLLVVILYYNNKDKPIGLSIILLILIGLIFFDAHNEHSNALQNIKDFKTKKYVLKCFSGGGMYSGSDTYRVSLDDGWELDKDYFIKESFMVRVSKCERW